MEARNAFIEALSLRFARFIPSVFALILPTFCLDFVAILISYWRVFFAPENRWKLCMSYFYDSLQC